MTSPKLTRAVLDEHADRRRRLTQTVNKPILLMGNGHRPRNLPMSSVAFRQDSTFLYFTGCTEPGAAVVLDGSESTLYLRPPADDDALWHGHSETIEQTAAQYGFERARSIDCLDGDVGRIGTIATIAVPDLAQTQRAARLSSQHLSFGTANGDVDLIEAIITMRRILSTSEIETMRQTAQVTREAHIAAMRATRPGVTEQHLASEFHNVVMHAGLTLAYPSIVTVRGEVLHNFHHSNCLQAGDLLLLDGGAESAGGYATDVTRTWPVTGSFSAQQRSAYDAVLESQLSGINLVRSGTRYRDIHMHCARVIAQFLADEGLITCDPDLAVEAGAHALFFPHGVGHLIGLDVHDLENFGDQAAYGRGRTRSGQFGTAYLRLDLDLEPGMVVTIEPGFYVVPAILGNASLRAAFNTMVNFDKAESWLGFGGIRIEDDVAVTHSVPDVLTAGIPKSIAELEAVISV